MFFVALNFKKFICYENIKICFLWLNPFFWVFVDKF